MTERGEGPVEPVTAVSPRPVGRALLTQSWRDVTFLHWPADPSAVAPLLPAGVRPDVRDGTTYVGLVPFRMRGLGFGRGPGLPYLGTFPETNVRVYGVDRWGRRGVVFLTLECARLLPVLGSRAALRLPYRWASMRRRTGDGGTLLWTSARIGPRGRGRPVTRVRVRVGERIAAPTDLEHFLTARWGLHTAWYGGRTVYLPNVHETWPLHRAELLECEEDLVAACGLPAPGGAPLSVLYAPRVDVRFGPPLAGGG
jgi:uncharacterized protein YqjF (DUF2071 family)